MFTTRSKNYGTTHDLEELAINVASLNSIIVVSVFKFCSRRGTRKRENVCNETGDHGNTHDLEELAINVSRVTFVKFHNRFVV